MKFLTFSSKKLPTLRKKSHNVDEIAFDEHGETMWKKLIFLKKLFAHEFVTDFALEFYGSFPEVAFCILKDTLRVESADPKKGLLFLFLKSDIKTYGLSAKLFHKDIYSAF